MGLGEVRGVGRCYESLVGCNVVLRKSRDVGIGDGDAAACDVGFGGGREVGRYDGKLDENELGARLGFRVGMGEGLKVGTGT